MAMVFCGTDTFTGNINVENVILFVIALFILRKWKLNPILVMLGTGVAGLIIGVV